MLKENGSPTMRLSEGERTAAGRLMEAIVSAITPEAFESSAESKRHARA